MKRVKRFGVLQTAKVAAVIYFLMSLVVFVPFFLFQQIISGVADSSGMDMFPFQGVTMLFVPVLYAIIGFITTAIGCFVYNIIAKWTGGIEVELESVDGEDMEILN